MNNRFKNSTFKMGWRNFMAFLTLGVLFHGVIQIKSFLMDNFVHNDTAIKRKINYALNGFPAKTQRSGTLQKESSPANVNVNLKDIE